MPAPAAQPMILKVHVPGACPYEIGDEIWQQTLQEAIAAEAEIVAEDAGSDLLESPDAEHRRQLRERVIAEMTSVLVHVGDRYRAPDGVLYSLTIADEESEPVTIASVTSDSAPTVQEVIRFEQLPIGSMASRRVLVRWTDGSEGEALRWYADEVQITEGDVLGKTAEQLRALHFRRDRDWLRS